LAASYFADTFFPRSPATPWVEAAEFISPIGAAGALPLDLDRPGVSPRPARWPVFFAFLAFYGSLNAAMVSTMSWLFHTRWRVAY
jgi:hypothetical protein